MTLDPAVPDEDDRQLAGGTRDDGSWQEARIAEDIRVKGRSPGDALANIADIERYTLEYPPERYTEGVRADIERLWREGARACPLNIWSGRVTRC